MKQFTYHKHEIKNIKNLCIFHILQVLKSSLSKNCLKSYVFDPFSKRVKGGDLNKSNGSEFHSLGAHAEKALSR